MEATDKKEFAIDEVAKHDKSGDLWLTMFGKVYDITKFADDHPGGDEVLLQQVGVDATKAFQDIGHSGEAVKMLEKYFIGTLKGGASAAPKKSSTAIKRSGDGSGDAMTWIVVLIIAAVCVVLLKMFAV